MIDPASAIAIATTAFTGIKKAVAVGKEISELGSDISKFGKAVSDLDYLGNKAEDPPLWKKFDPKFDRQLGIRLWLLRPSRENSKRKWCIVVRKR